MGPFSLTQSNSIQTKPIHGWIQWLQNEFESEGHRGPERKWREGGTDPLRSAGKKFCGRAPPLFLALKVLLVVLVSAFVMVSSQYSLVSFLLAVFLLTVPPVPSHL